jgi:hypothetical protein
VTHNGALTHFTASRNALVSLDVSHNTRLQRIYLVTLVSLLLITLTTRVCAQKNSTLSVTPALERVTLLANSALRNVDFLNGVPRLKYVVSGWSGC